MDGIELNGQLPLSTLHESLEGFGIAANYTWLDSSLAGESDLGILTPMPGLAEKTYNFTAYYENDRFDARVSYNHKGEYVESIGYDMYPIWRDAYGQVDISIGYRINRHASSSALKGINMTNEATSGLHDGPVVPDHVRAVGSSHESGHPGGLLTGSTASLCRGGLADRHGDSPLRAAARIERAALKNEEHPDAHAAPCCRSRRYRFADTSLHAASGCRAGRMARAWLAGDHHVHSEWSVDWDRVDHAAHAHPRRRFAVHAHAQRAAGREVRA